MKVSELTGTQLDYWVAKAAGIRVAIPPIWRDCAEPGYARTKDIKAFPFGPPAYSPSTDWMLGGPIIEREQMHLIPPEPADQCADPRWLAHIGRPEAAWQGNGPTPLIAAMRAFVALKFGDEVVDSS